jgi:hypothetical protein
LHQKKVSIAEDDDKKNKNDEFDNRCVDEIDELKKIFFQFFNLTEGQ